MITILEFLFLVAALLGLFHVLILGSNWVRGHLAARKAQAEYDALTEPQKFETRVTWIQELARLAGEPITREQASEMVRKYDAGLQGP